MSGYVLAIDQGTTSTRAIVFDDAFRIIGVGQQEFPQIFPRSGWVEHDPEDIWRSVLATVRTALADASLSAGDLAGIGITNQRETTLVWDRETGKPIHNAIVWQDRRTADFCRQLVADGVEPLLTRKTGLLADPYFSGTKLRWLLDNVDGAPRKSRGRQARLRHRRQLPALATDRRQGACDRRHQCQPHADVRHCDEPVGRRVAAPPRHSPVASAGGEGLRRRFRRDRHLAFRCRHPDPRRRRRPARGDARSGLFQTGHAEIDLRHRVLRRAEHRHHQGHVGKSAADDDRLSPRWRHHLCVGGLDLHRRRRRAVAARRAEADGAVRSLGADGRRSRRQAGRLPRARLYRTRRALWDADARGALYGLTRNTGPNEIARAALEAVCYQTADLLDAMRRDWTADGDTVLRVDGGMVASDWTMQRLADLLAAPVDRPVVLETTALGAAWLAGHRAGVWPDREGFAERWQLERRFEPGMDDGERQRKLDGWQDAVRRTLTS